jgi:hypothetical protein
MGIGRFAWVFSNCLKSREADPSRIAQEFFPILLCSAHVRYQAICSTGSRNGPGEVVHAVCWSQMEQ